MSLSRDAERSIGSSLHILLKLLESDTEISMIDLNLLENLNTNQSLNYIKLEQTINTLDGDNEFLMRLGNEYKEYKKSLGHIEGMVDNIDALTREIDAWSKEIEQKMKA